MPGDSTSSGTVPRCGNQIIEDGETCDDGNTDDSDACTTLCDAPRCDDGLWSGLETDVDCGGPQCDACGPGDGCNGDRDCAEGQLCDPKTGSCRPPASCLEHLDLDENARSGPYEIDPLGDGGTISVFCEMDESGGGWTRLLDQTFDSGGGGWIPPWTYSCGPNATLGPLGSGQDATLSVDLLGVPHTEAWVYVGYLMIDNWEFGESAYVRVDGLEATALPYPGGLESDYCGASSEDWYNEMQGFPAHVANTAQIAIGSTLDEAIGDEFLLVFLVELFVR